MRRHQGAEIKTEGDSFYVVFESPAAAIDCAVSILRAAAERAGTEPDRPLRIGMGLHAGETVPFDDQFVGSAVNVGARLASKAGPGELLISDTFRGLVRTGVTYRMTDLGPQRLKGVDERIRAWRVEWDASRPAAATARAATAPDPVRSAPEALLPAATAPPPGPRGELLCPVVVGRERELAVVEAALEAAAAGNGALVLVSGEAGVGKTALLRELQRMAAARSFALLPGITLESDAGLPYAPYVSALRSGYRESGPDALRTALERLSPDLLTLFPEIERRERERSTASTVERHRIPVAFATLLSRLSSVSPVALLLEDVHWADEASLAALERLGREIVQWRVVIAATYRSDELHRLHPLMRTVASLRRDRIPREVALAPLDRDASAALVRAAAADDPRVTDEVSAAIYRRAQGNPFFTEELLRAVVDSHGRADAPVPASVHDAVRSRLQHLGPSARATVAAASAFGERCSFELLRLVRGVDDGALAADLREAIDDQILVEAEGGMEPVYAFRHALTREIVYEQMLLPERRRLHLLAAQALATDAGTEPAVLAEQWRLGGERERAAEAYVSAGRSALALYAPRDAVAHVERAIEMRGVASLEDYELMARAYLFFDPVKAREASDRGLDLMPRHEPVLRRIRLMRLAGRARYLLGDAAGNADLARTAWELADEGGDVPARAEAADWMAMTRITAGQEAEAREWADRAVAAARSSGLLAVEGNAVVSLATAVAVDDPVRSLRLLDDAAALARRTASADVMARVHQNGVVASFAVESERPRLVRIDRALEFAARYAYRPATFAAFQLFHDLLALRWPQPGARGEGDPEDLFGAWIEVMHLTVEACRLGPDHDIRERCARLVERLRATNEAQWALPWLGVQALLAEWAGDRDACSATYADAMALARRHEDPDLAPVALSRGLHALSAVGLILGDTEAFERAGRRLADAEGYSGDRDAMSALSAAIDGGDPREDFERSAAAHRQRGLRFTTALLLWALAKRGAADRAWPSVAAVTADLRNAGATALGEEVTALLG